MGATQAEIETATAALQAAADVHDAALASALRKLGPALTAVSDALAKLSPDEWQALCAEEAETVAATLQYWDFTGVPQVMVPEMTLGGQILSVFAKKYPHLTSEAELQ